MSFHRVVVGVDGTSESLAALALARQLAAPDASISVAAMAVLPTAVAMAGAISDVSFVRDDAERWLLGAREALAGRPAYLHVDCDVLEPGQVPSEYAVPGGITLATLRESCAVLAEAGLGGIELAEFEAEFPDGRPGDPAPLLAALEPALEALRRA